MIPLTVINTDEKEASDACRDGKDLLVKNIKKEKNNNFVFNSQP